MEGMTWPDLGPWSMRWPEESALDRLADSAGQKSEREPDAQAHALSAWHQAQCRPVRCDRPPLLRADEPADHRA
jgi:hypothetical protein